MRAARKNQGVFAELAPTSANFLGGRNYTIR